MWKIFCTEVVVVVVVFVVVVAVVVVVPDSGFDRKRKQRDTTISFLPEAANHFRQ